MRKLVVHHSEPLIQKSTFSSDLRLIFIQFDQNINPSSECMKAFSPETMSLFGKGEFLQGSSIHESRSNDFTHLKIVSWSL